MGDTDKNVSGQPRLDTDGGEEGDVLAWTSHPVTRRPVVSALATAFLALVAVVVFYATTSFGFALLALVVLFASLARFYFPTSYRLSDRGIMVKTATHTLRKGWSQYRSCYADRNGILLSPFTQPSRLENFRGLFLLFSENREAVIAFVKARIGRQAAPPKDTEETTPVPDSASDGRGQ